MVARNEDNLVTLPKNSSDRADEKRMVVEDGSHRRHGMFRGTWQVVKFAHSTNDARRVEIENVPTEDQRHALRTQLRAQGIEHPADFGVRQTGPLPIAHPRAVTRLDFAKVHVRYDDRMVHHTDTDMPIEWVRVGGFPKNGYSCRRPGRRAEHESRCSHANTSRIEIRECSAHIDATWRQDLAFRCSVSATWTVFPKQRPPASMHHALTRFISGS